MNHDQSYLDNLRHSAAHLLAAAIMDLYPDTKRTIGPAIENGFYFDFEFSQPFSEADFDKVELRMRQILKTWKEFEHHELSEEQARAEYPGNQYKQELIDEIVARGETLTFYKSGDYWDLCRGGHVEKPNEELKHFKLLSVAGAYWRGDEKNAMLTRIYGTAFPSKEELQAYLVRLEEAKKRDHKVIGKDLGLFTFSETVGKGLPLWTPKGATIRRELERFIVDEEIKRGYLHVYTPDIAKIDLYKKSGHYPYYKDSMYAPIEIDDESYMLRPMTCPHHFELYLSQPHSYRDLPMRIAELAQLYRYEQSGELSGLLRVRTFCLADAHIICADDEQAKQEVNGALDLIEYVAETLGLKMGENYSYRLSLGDRSNTTKYYNNPEAWDIAEQKLREVLQERGCGFTEAADEAAFYGPKIDIQMRNVMGKEDTAFTVQYDFAMPGRFQLNYINEAGQEQEARVIHRSSVGAIERIMAFMIEHFAGAFPLWLAPVQVAVVPITKDHAEYAETVVQHLKSLQIRAENWDQAESMQKRIRNAEKAKVPYMLIVGDQEKASNSVAVRQRGNQNLGTLSLLEITERLQKEIKEKTR